MVQLSEETKVYNTSLHIEEIWLLMLQERIGRVIDMGKVAIHYGWIPMILYIGEHFVADRR
jgi:hypothetical protein